MAFFNPLNGYSYCNHCMKPVSDKTCQKSSVLKHPERRYLICELRQLMQLTQTQLAEELGVTYETINRWENGHIQPSPLALKQIRFVIGQLNQSSSAHLRDGSQLLLDKYFSGKQNESKQGHSP